MKDTPLEAIPSMQATWKFWRERHPDTRVMKLEGTDGRPYVYSNFAPGEERRREGAHDTSTLGLGFAVGSDAWFFPLRALAGVDSPLDMTIGGQRVMIHHDTDALTAWAEDADGNLLMSVVAYESGWKTFFPETRIYE